MGITTCRGWNGTVRGYLDHLHHNTRPCIGCVTAWRQYQQRGKPNRRLGLATWPLCGAEHPYTPAGYTWHQATGTKPCIGCETAHNETTPS